MAGLKVGLLGGSFNPAHDGHLQISLTALRSLGLDQVWWLVSPQNPLKSTEGMADYAARLQSAEQKVAGHPAIRISDFEKRLGETYTANTLARLKACYPQNHFVWLMGADNLIQITRWYKWQEIFEQVPVAVFDRPGYTYRALSGKAASLYRHVRVFPPASRKPDSRFANRTAPCWIFLPQTKLKLSSTDIRKNRIN
ncbi:nicotinate-nucleotide adenylyltransferase [Sneathiella chinensis]|uniref:Probable nicotinate-nucleotide adenylyltransferase n=1 Tax=Sneathiella chinensis TaxID=349750 RepID=A0ABQ5U6W3_9PROT|nr:nicotinate-nucleotide adenylyltransferase [Sneathiella chinensis]GLQ07879.1 putative nicotinate-nucleotide adenylyltransferase [Sneathiella chinensis]